MILTQIIDPITEHFNWLGDISNPWTIGLRILLTIICGGIIGLERTRKRHVAGFRTYILVCLGAAIVMILNDFLTINSGADPSRLGAQVISGIGFLGAGTIFVTSNSRIKGLTTAAGLWAAACTGLAIGAGFYTLSLFATISIVAILSIMPSLEGFFRNRSRVYELHVELHERSNLKDLVNYLRNMNIQIISIEKNPAYHSSGLSVYTILLSSKEKMNRVTFLSTIKNLEYVNHCEEMC